MQFPGCLDCRQPLPAGDRRPRLVRQRVRIGLQEVVGIDTHECEAARDLEAGEAVLPAVAALAMREPERLVLSGPGLKSLLPCLATSESLDRDHQGGTAGNSIGYPIANEFDPPSRSCGQPECSASCHGAMMLSETTVKDAQTMSPSVRPRWRSAYRSAGCLAVRLGAAWQ
jgi:hypothetical protein